MTRHDVRIVATALSADEQAAVRRLLDEAFAGDFGDGDWQHALGGWHVVMRSREAIVAHAAVVERRLWVGSQALRAGYVEAVAVTPRLQRSGLGSVVMTMVNDLIREHFDIGALSTGEWPFYERLGWERWQGETWVRMSDGRLLRTADEDAGVMVLRHARSPAVDVRASLACEDRPGDSW